MRAAWRCLRQYLRFLALPAAQRRLVVYSEGPASWPHLGPVVQAWLASGGQGLVYVSSAADDPGAALQHPGLHTAVIGDGAVRTMFFAALQAEVLLTTLPDIGSFQLKRSAGTRHSVYLHHSMVSCHMAYRAAAFDQIDTMLCAGPHHATEMRAIAAKRGLPAKAVLPHGYARIDALLAGAALDCRDATARSVLVAPSWGPQGLLERHAEPLMQALAGCAWRVVVRPHPQTLRLAPQAIDTVRHWCRRAGNLHLELGVAGHDTLRRADLMVSDWSGAAFDFALGLERPVLFVDVPRKANNPAHAELGIEPIEAFARNQLGRVVSPQDLAGLPMLLDELLADSASYRVQIADFRRQWLHHPGGSAAAAVAHLQQLLAGPNPPAC
jgi:hypothetical protein